MSYDSDVSVLVNFASQLQFAHHPYVKRKESGKGFELSNTKNTQDLSALILSVSNHEYYQKSQLKLALSIIESHLKNKISGLFSFLINKEDKARIQELITKIQTVP